MTVKHAKKLTPGSAAAAMTAIESSRDRAVDRLAKQVWREIVVPACRKHNLEFRAGMGVYLLSIPGGENLYDAEDAANHGFKLKRLFAALDIPVSPPQGRLGSPQPLGSLMDDFIP